MAHPGSTIFFWSCWTWLTIFIILSITTHIWKHLAPLLFDCNERFPHRNSNKLIICSYRIHSEPWCETQMLVSISFQSIHKRFVCGTETRCLSLNNDTLSHLTETVETAMTAPFHRSSLIHFVCIWVAPPRLSTPQPREQSRVHNSNAGKIDQSWSNPFMNNVLSFILSMPVCWFVAFIVNLIVVAQVTIPNLKTTLQAILPCCFFSGAAWGWLIMWYRLISWLFQTEAYWTTLISRLGGGGSRLDSGLV